MAPVECAVNSTDTRSKRWRTRREYNQERHTRQYRPIWLRLRTRSGAKLADPWAGAPPLQALDRDSKSLPRQPRQVADMSGHAQVVRTLH